MIAFGVAEVATGFTHNFFGLSTAHSAASTYLGASIGLLYILAGTLVLSMRRWAAALAVIALVLDVVGRIAMVSAGYYRLTSAKQTFSIVAGTVIAVAFAVYVSVKWRDTFFAR
jgi:hypothetical protein